MRNQRKVVAARKEVAAARTKGCCGKRSFDDGLRPAQDERVFGRSMNARTHPFFLFLSEVE
jgi:hypothetical protein